MDLSRPTHTPVGAQLISNTFERATMAAVLDFLSSACNHSRFHKARKSAVYHLAYLAVDLVKRSVTTLIHARKNAEILGNAAEVERFRGKRGLWRATASLFSSDRGKGSDSPLLEKIRIHFAKGSCPLLSSPAGIHSSFGQVVLDGFLSISQNPKLIQGMNLLAGSFVMAMVESCSNRAFTDLKHLKMLHEEHLLSVQSMLGNGSYFDGRMIILGAYDSHAVEARAFEDMTRTLVANGPESRQQFVKEIAKSVLAQIQQEVQQLIVQTQQQDLKDKIMAKDLYAANSEIQGGGFVDAADQGQQELQWWQTDDSEGADLMARDGCGCGGDAQEGEDLSSKIAASDNDKHAQEDLSFGNWD